MTKHPIILALSLAIAGTPPAGMHPLDGPCGWDPAFSPPGQMPRGVSGILTAAEARGLEPDATADLRRWFTGCDAGASRDATATFRRAVERNRSDLVLKAAYAVSLARGIEVQVPGAEGYFYRTAFQFSNSERDAARLFTSIADDTAWAEIGLEAAALAVATRNPTTVKEADKAIAALLKRLPDDALLLAAAAEVAIVREDYAHAAASARRAMALGNPAAQRTLGIASMLADRDPAAGAAAYFAGIASADPAVLARYYEDLKPLLTPAERAAWSPLDSAQRGPWLLAAWEWRAAQSSTDLPRRLALHHRRIAYAFDAYLRTAVRGPRPGQALRVESAQLALPFQDRGVIYIRHGEPDESVSSATRSGGQRLAWIYFHIGTDPTVIEFRKSPGYADFVASGPPPCSPLPYMYPGASESEAEANLSRAGVAALKDSVEMRPPTTLRRGSTTASATPATRPSDQPSRYWRNDFEQDVLQFATSVGAYAPQYATSGVRCYNTIMREVRAASGQLGQAMGSISQLLSEIAFQKAATAQTMRAAQATYESALRIESARPSFSRILKPVTSVYMFRGAANTDIVVFTAIDGAGLTSVPRQPGVGYDLRLSLSLEDNVKRRAQRVDTTLTFGSATPLQSGQIVRTSMTINAAAAQAQALRLMIANANDSTQGQIILTNRDIADFGSFDVSDLVIAEPEGGVWRRGSASLSPIPGHQVRQGATIRLFYEVYGARADDRIQTAVTIAPDRPSGIQERLSQLVQRRQAVSVTFDDVAELDSDAVFRKARELGAELEPGNYIVTVTVTNARSRQTAGRETRLRVID